MNPYRQMYLDMIDETKLEPKFLEARKSLGREEWNDMCAAVVIYMYLCEHGESILYQAIENCELSDMFIDEETVH